MRGLSLLAVVAAILAVGPTTTPIAWAGGPVVISGVGPDVAYRQAPPQSVAAAGGGMGGGFIEMMMTGGQEPSRGSMRPPPEMMPAAPMMAPAPQMAPRGAPMQRAYVEPRAEPQMGVHRAIEPRFMRQEVNYDGHQAVGSIIVDTPNRYLFLVTAPGRALRYGIGVGRPGFEWAGVKTVSRKAEWPGWTPPPEMLLRRPDLPKHMDGGPQNPLGARALYLGSSMYRIHGTNEPWTIGQNVSSGCIRMMNDDVVDLYERVKVGTKVQVI
jgi:lipoprotein-anchoring transpeptidase ErfK/SrfK